MKLNDILKPLRGLEAPEQLASDLINWAFVRQCKRGKGNEFSRTYTVTSLEEADGRRIIQSALGFLPKEFNQLRGSYGSDRDVDVYECRALLSDEEFDKFIVPLQEAEKRARSEALELLRFYSAFDAIEPVLAILQVAAPDRGLSAPCEQILRTMRDLKL